MQGTAGDRGICNSVYTNCWSAAESDAFNSGKLRITTKGLPAGTYKFKVTVSIFEKVAGFAGADAYVYPAGQDVIGKHLHSSDQIAKTSNFSTNLTVAVTNSSPSEEVEIMRYDIQGAISPNRWGSSEVTTTISVQPIPP